MKPTDGKYVLGITGGVGAGKSTVLEYLRSVHKAKVLESDRIAQSLQEPGGSCFGPMVDLLGTEILKEDGTMDRAKAASMIFTDADLLKAVNQIVHPAVLKYVQDEIRYSNSEEEIAFTVVESALLLDAGLDAECDSIWYIYADPEVRIKRLASSRGYSRERVLATMNSQKSDGFFRMHTDLTIDNSADDVQNTFKQIDEGLIKYGIL